MAEEVRPKLPQVSQVSQGRDVPPPPPPASHSTPLPKQEDDEQDRLHRQLPPPPPQQQQMQPVNTVTLPSFREAYGSALAQYPAPPPPPHQPYVDPLSRSGPASRPPYPDSPNGLARPILPGPPGPPGPPMQMANGPDYPRMHHPDVPSRDSKDYYSYQYGPYADRAPPPPHPSYWSQHAMPPSYQAQPPESAPRQRTSIACKYCRKRKIRCSGYQNTPDGKCTNCKKTGNDCVFQPVSSTTSTAFVPVSAIQGGVPPGTPLYGAFGQPLGPNGGRGSAPNGAPGGPPPGGHPGSGHGSHGSINGGSAPSQHPGYCPTSPGDGSYYQQHTHSPMDQSGPPPPPPLPASAQSQGPSQMTMRQLPLPYPQQQPAGNGYGGENQRRLSIKRPREDEEAEYASRLPPPPPAYASHHGNGYYGPPDERRSPSVHGGSVPTSGSPTNSHPMYGHGPLPPPPMSSVGTERDSSSTSVRSNGSVAETAATSPVERYSTRSPSGEVEEVAKQLVQLPPPETERYLQAPQQPRDYELGAGRDIDRFMLNRLGTASAYHGEPLYAHHPRERM